MKHIQIAAIFIAGLLALATGAAAPGAGPAPALAAPANDDFANAITVTTPAVSGVVAAGSTAGASSQFLEPDTFPANSCFFGSPGWIYGNSVWFNWTSPATPGSIRIDTWGSDFDTSLVVFTGNTVSSLAGVPGGCSQGFLTNSANPALVQLTYAANTLYRIQVSGVNYATGNFVLSLVSGSEIVVNSTADNTTSDGNMTLREAIHVATGTLGRALSGGEAGVVVGTAGAGSDAIRFNDNLFPPGAPSTITLTQGLPSTFLNSNKMISGIGAGVIIDGNNLNIECIRLEGNYNHIEGLQFRRCATGVYMGGLGNVFGGTLGIQRNLVRENTSFWGYGLHEGGSFSQVIGNFFGTDATGTVAAGNGQGVREVGTNATISGNLISGNSTGVFLAGYFNTLVGNKIGTKSDGTGDLGNSGNGVELYNYGQEIGGNIIAGNNGHGILIDQASEDVIKGNYIGLDVNGTAVGNLLRGISMTNSSAITIGGPSLEDRNHIAANGSDGILINGSSNNVIKNNYIGLNANWTVRPNGGAGIKVLGAGAENNVIGAPGEGNTISGNGTRGIEMEGGTSNSGTIRGNNIGVDPGGLSDLGNALDGIYLGSAAVTVGGPGPGDGNIISGNNGHGIIAISNGHVIQGNLIGVGSNFGGIGNGGDGIRLLSSTGGVQIGGGDGPGGNVIAGNGGAGVYVYDGAILFGNLVRLNTIFANGGPGIDLEYGNWPAPVIQQYLGGVLVGYVPGCAACTVDVFQDTAGEGQYYVGTTSTNAGTAWSLSGVAHTLGQFTAIATTTGAFFGDSTSEFSAPFDAVMNSDGDAMPDSTDPCPLAAEDYDAYFDGDGCPDSDNDVDGICDPGQSALGCTGADTGKTCFDPAGTLPCATFDCRNIAEDWDNFKDSDGCPEPDNDNDGLTDGVDQCPGVDWQTGPDGMFGAAQDQNHNGIKDPTEALFTTDDVLLAFEDRDGVLDTDGCHDSPGEDFDGDGFTDDNEALKIGTNPGYPCGNPGWPADLLADNRLNIGDFNSFLFPLRGNGSFNKFGHPVLDPDDANIARWNLLPDATINIGDLNALNPAVLAPTARPPMFGGQPAFFANAGNGIGGCPLPP